MYATEIEEMHSKPGRFRVVYWSQADDTTPAERHKQIWKEDLAERDAKQEEIVCYRTLNEL